MYNIMALSYSVNVHWAIKCLSGCTGNNEKKRFMEQFECITVEEGVSEKLHARGRRGGAGRYSRSAKLCHGSCAAGVSHPTSDTLGAFMREHGFDTAVMKCAITATVVKAPRSICSSSKAMIRFYSIDGGFEARHRVSPANVANGA